jgi:uridine kinase
MVSSGQPSFVIAIAGASGAGKTTLVKEVAALLGEAVTFYFDDYSEYPPDVDQWLQEGGDLKQWETPRLTEDLRALKFGAPLVLSEAARFHREAVGETHPQGILEPARFIVMEEPFGRERPGLETLVDFVVGLDTPLDLALARRLLRDVEYHRQGIHKGDLADYMKAILLDYQGPLRDLYLVAQQVAIHHSDLVVDGTKPVEVLAQEIVDKVLSL